MLKTDVVIIGAGAVGCAIARELSKYAVDVLVVDKNDDVGGCASKSNSAIIHTGYDATPGTLESRLVVAANPMYGVVCKDLDIPFQKVGAILPAITQEQFEKLPSIKEKAFKNHVYDVEYMGKDEILAMEPNLNPEVLGGLYIPRESIIDPFVLVTAMAENANENGVDFLLNSKIIKVNIENSRVFSVETETETIETQYVINATGLYGDEIAALVAKKNYTINPRKGQFYILDKNTNCKVNTIVLPIPTKITKGKLMCPTVHGNMLVGPTAEDLTDKEDKSTTTEGLLSIEQDVKRLIPNVNLRDTITQYAGLRPNKTPEGVSVDQYDDVMGFVNISGVRSTGITLSLAMGKYVVQSMVEKGFSVALKASFRKERRGIVRFCELSHEARHQLILENPLYGNVVCRCETITEGEVVAAIQRPVGARSVDGVKRRVRAGLGRCQGGFCGGRVLEILARELGVAAEEINKNVGGSFMITGRTR